MEWVLQYPWSTGIGILMCRVDGWGVLLSGTPRSSAEELRPLGRVLLSPLEVNACISLICEELWDF